MAFCTATAETGPHILAACLPIGQCSWGVSIHERARVRVPESVHAPPGSFILSTTGQSLYSGYLVGRIGPPVAADEAKTSRIRLPLRQGFLLQCAQAFRHRRIGPDPLPVRKDSFS